MPDHSKITLKIDAGAGREVPFAPLKNAKSAAIVDVQALEKAIRNINASLGETYIEPLGSADVERLAAHFSGKGNMSATLTYHEPAKGDLRFPVVSDTVYTIPLTPENTAEVALAFEKASHEHGKNNIRDSLMKSLNLGTMKGVTAVADLVLPKLNGADATEAPHSGLAVNHPKPIKKDVARG